MRSINEKKSCYNYLSEKEYREIAVVSQTAPAVTKNVRESRPRLHLKFTISMRKVKFSSFLQFLSTSLTQTADDEKNGQKNAKPIQQRAQQVLEQHHRAFFAFWDAEPMLHKSPCSRKMTCMMFDPFRCSQVTFEWIYCCTIEKLYVLFPWTDGLVL